VVTAASAVTSRLTAAPAARSAAATAEGSGRHKAPGNFHNLWAAAKLDRPCWLRHNRPHSQNLYRNGREHV